MFQCRFQYLFPIHHAVIHRVDDHEFHPFFRIFRVKGFLFEADLRT